VNVCGGVFIVSRSHRGKSAQLGNRAQSITHVVASNRQPVTLALQVAWMFILGVPVACVAWTVTHEEVFREPRQYCHEQSARSPGVFRRKFFYLFTCEYCFSHYVAAAALLLTRFKLLFGDWRGYLLAFFALVWVANQYMSIYNRLRLDIKHEQVEIKADEQVVEERKAA
jgi:hypothetical protein